MNDYTAILTIPLEISHAEYVALNALLDKEQPTEDEANEIFVLAARHLIANLGL